MKRKKTATDLVLSQVSRRYFPGSLRETIPGRLRLATCFNFKRGNGIVVMKDTSGNPFGDLAAWAEWCVMQRNPYSYLEFERFFQDRDIKFIPEFVFPVTDREVSKSLGDVSVLRVDWYLPEYGVVVECDYDTNHRKSKDYVRDQYLEAEYGIRGVIRVTKPNSLASNISKGLNSLDQCWCPQIFSLNSEKLWFNAYSEQIEFANNYFNKYGRNPYGPEITLGGCYKLSESELLSVKGEKFQDILRNNPEFLKKLITFYLEFFRLPIKIVSSQNVFFPGFKVLL